MIPDIGAVQGGLLALLGTIVTVLFTLRGTNKVKNDNASANRESRFQDNLQARHDAALKRIDDLQAELLTAREGKALLTRQLKEQMRKTMNLLEVMDPNERQRVERWVKDVSSFAPFDSGSGRKL